MAMFDTFRRLWAAFLLIGVAFWGCSTPEPKPSLLDQFAGILEEEAPFYWEQDKVHWQPAPFSNGTRLDVQVGRMELFPFGEGQLQMGLRNEVKGKAYDAEGNEVWSFLAREGAFRPGFDSLHLTKRILMRIGEEEFEMDKLSWVPSAQSFFAVGNVQLMNTEMLIVGDTLIASGSFDAYRLRRVYQAVRLDEMTGN